MIDNCYKFTELCEKFNWPGQKVTEIERQIIYAERRGVIIEVAFKQGATYFRILQDNTLLPGEEWRKCPTDNLQLEVSNFGRVRNVEDKKLLGIKNSKGYLHILKNNIHYSIHRLVMQTFSPIEDDRHYVVDHINGKRDDNRLVNLRWCMDSDNQFFRDQNNTELKDLLAQLIQKYGYEGTKKHLQSLL